MKFMHDLSPGDIVIAHDDFALLLTISEDGWPEEWMWLVNCGHVHASSVGRPALKYLFEGRAILHPDGRVTLCQHDRSLPGWNEKALLWWKAAETEALRESW